MAATIKIKNSSTASAVPTASDLVQGELAINLTDKRIFTENASGTVVELGINPTSMTVAGDTTIGGGLTVDTTTLKVDATNNRVGVGTASPATLVDLAASNTGLTSTTANNTLRFTDTNTTTTTDQPLGKIEWYSSDASSSARVGAYILSTAQGTSGGGNLEFATASNTGTVTEQMVIGSDGIITATVGNLMLISDTAVTTTSGTSVTFTDIPSWTKRISILLSNVSTSGTSDIKVQIGDSGGLETSSYSGSCNTFSATPGATPNSTGFLINETTNASAEMCGIVTLANVSGNTWVSSHSLGLGGAVGSSIGGGSKTLSGTLTQLSILTENGTDTFDNGSINILCE